MGEPGGSLHEGALAAGTLLDPTARVKVRPPPGTNPNK